MYCVQDRGDKPRYPDPMPGLLDMAKEAFERARLAEAERPTFFKEQLLPGKPLREAVANAPVVGGALGFLRGPMLLGDEELLQSASPLAMENARLLGTRLNPENPDQGLANSLRASNLGMAFAGSGDKPKIPFGKLLGKLKQAVDPHGSLPDVPPRPVARPPEGPLPDDFDITSDAPYTPSPQAAPPSATTPPPAPSRPDTDFVQRRTAELEALNRQAEGAVDPGPNPFEGRSYQSLSREELEASNQWAMAKSKYNRAQAGIAEQPTATPAGETSPGVVERMGAGAQRLRAKRPVTVQDLGEAVGNPSTPPPPGPPGKIVGKMGRGGRLLREEARLNRDPAYSAEVEEYINTGKKPAEPSATPRPPTDSGKKYYAGVGSRATPPDIQAFMTRIAEKLKSTHVLRSGAAEGADTAFETGAGGVHEIYLPAVGYRGRRGEGIIDRPTPQARVMAREIHPNWGALDTQFKQDLMARNSHQVLGERLDSPVDFVLAWTPDGADGVNIPVTRATGGTGQAIRLANKNGIKVYNLANPETYARFQKFLGDEGPPVGSPPTRPAWDIDTVPQPEEVSNYKPPRVQGPKSFTPAGAVDFPDATTPIVTKDGTVIGQGYRRVVHGGRGDYVELAPHHIDKAALTSKYGDPDAPLPDRAFYRWLEAGPNKTKVYEQAKTVGYADYKPGHYYVSPDDLQGFEYPGRQTGAPAAQAPAAGRPASKFQARMDFAFNGRQRPGVTSKTTFEAIQKGERTSTTRFDSWKGSEKWANAEPGDIVEFTGPKNEKVYVRVTGVDRVDMKSFTPEQLDAWSQSEGWNLKEAEAMKGKGPGWQIHYELVDPSTLSQVEPPATLSQATQVRTGPTEPGTDTPMTWEEIEKVNAEIQEHAKKYTEPTGKSFEPDFGGQLESETALTGIERQQRMLGDTAYRSGFHLQDPVILDKQGNPMLESMSTGPDDKSMLTSRLPGEFPPEKLMEGVGESRSEQRIMPTRFAEPIGRDTASLDELLGHRADIGSERKGSNEATGMYRTAEDRRIAERAEQIYNDELAQAGGDPLKTRAIRAFLTNKIYGADYKTQVVEGKKQGIPKVDKEGKTILNEAGEPEWQTHKDSLVKRVEFFERNKSKYRGKGYVSQHRGNIVPALVPGWEHTPKGQAFLEREMWAILTQRYGDMANKSPNDIAKKLLAKAARNMAVKADYMNPEGGSGGIRMDQPDSGALGAEGARGKRDPYAKTSARDEGIESDEFREVGMSEYDAFSEAQTREIDKTSTSGDMPKLQFVDDVGDDPARAAAGFLDSDEKAKKYGILTKEINTAMDRLQKLSMREPGDLELDRQARTLERQIVFKQSERAKLVGVEEMPDEGLKGLSDEIEFDFEEPLTKEGFVRRPGKKLPHGVTGTIHEGAKAGEYSWPGDMPSTGMATENLATNKAGRDVRAQEQDLRKLYLNPATRKTMSSSDRARAERSLEKSSLQAKQKTFVANPGEGANWSGYRTNPPGYRQGPHTVRAEGRGQRTPGATIPEDQAYFVRKMAEILDVIPKMHPGQFQWMTQAERRVWEDYMAGKLARSLEAGGARTPLPLNELLKRTG